MTESKPPFPPFDAQTAVRAGIVARIVKSEELAAVIAERASTLSRKPLASLVATKRLLRQHTRSDVREVMRRKTYP